MYPGYVITSVLVRGRREGQSQTRGCDDKSRCCSDAIAGRRPGANEPKQPLEAGKDKGLISP